MRVGVVVYGSLDARSGGSLYDRRLVDHLRAAGDDVGAFSLPERGYGRALLQNAFRSLARRLRRADLDVILQDERCHPSLFAFNERFDLGAPTLSIVHRLRSDERHPPWRSRLYREVERRYLRSVDGFVFNSRATRDSVAALTDPEPSVVAHPAGDRFGDPPSIGRVRRRARERPLRVVFVGTVTRRKGLETLVDGLERVAGDWRLTVVGDTGVEPAYVDAVSRRAERRGVADRVRFVGRLDDESLAETLSESHLVAVPSDHEGFGIAYVEGMGFGLPAVASAAGGASELVRHRVNGLLVPPDDPSAVTDAVAPLCWNRERLTEMSVAALETYRRHPTWAESCERIREFLLSVVEGEPTESPLDR